jgi:hypothetical protein
LYDGLDRVSSWQEAHTTWVRQHNRGGAWSHTKESREHKGALECSALNPTTLVKWRKRCFAPDAPMGSKEVHSNVLSVSEEAMLVSFRKQTLLPLDDCLYALQATIPPLTRSRLHRCLQRHGVSRLPELEGDKPLRKKLKTIP